MDLTAYRFNCYETTMINRIQKGMNKFPKNERTTEEGKRVLCRPESQAWGQWKTDYNCVEYMMVKQIIKQDFFR